MWPKNVGKQPQINGYWCWVIESTEWSHATQSREEKLTQNTDVRADSFINFDIVPVIVVRQPATKIDNSNFFFSIYLTWS